MVKPASDLASVVHIQSIACICRAGWSEYAFWGSRILGSLNDEAKLGFGGGVKPHNFVGSVLHYAAGFDAIAAGGMA